MPPIDAYFHGKGKKVLANMEDEYGKDKGKRVFYALANKKGEKPDAKAKAGTKSAGRRRALSRM